MLWEEVRINHSKLSNKSITLLQVESMVPLLWIAGLVPVPTSAWWATQCTWQTDWSGTISGIIRWGHRWTIHTRLTLFIQVQLVVTLLPTNAKDDLAQFSNSKFIGSYQLQLEGEREVQGYTVRTFKVKNYRHVNYYHTDTLEVTNRHNNIKEWQWVTRQTIIEGWMRVSAFKPLVREKSKA